jgi:hypothetical protein
MKVCVAILEYFNAYRQTGIPYEWEHARIERGENLN